MTTLANRGPRSIRFGVKDPYSGLCSETWKVWVGSRKRDVYLVCRAIGRDIKLSLHESGRWHFAFQRPDAFDDETRPTSKFVGEYQRPTPAAGVPTLAVQVHIPWFAATLAPASEQADDTVWIPPATLGQSVEVALFLFDSGKRPPDDWPGKEGMGMQFVGEVDLAGGGAVVIVHRTVPVLGIPERPAKANFFKGQTREDLETLGLRMVAWGSNPDGSLILMEMPVRVER